MGSIPKWPAIDVARTALVMVLQKEGLEKFVAADGRREMGVAYLASGGARQ